MQFSITYAVAVRAVIATALMIFLGSGCSYAYRVKSKPVATKVSQETIQPVKLRYYGGPKSPMYP
jgi:hypothetical protein